VTGVHIRRPKNRGFIRVRSNGIFSFPKLSDLLLVCGEGVELVGGEVDNSLRYGDDVNNGWNLTVIGKHYFYAQCFILAFNINKHNKYKGWIQSSGNTAVT
jgi:hypothetical protein